MQTCIPRYNSNDVFLLYFLFKPSPLHQEEKDESYNALQRLKFISLKSICIELCLNLFFSVKLRTFKRKKNVHSLCFYIQ